MYARAGMRRDGRNEQSALQNRKPNSAYVYKPPICLWLFISLWQDDIGTIKPPKNSSWFRLKDWKTSYKQMHSVRMHSIFCTFDLFFCICLLMRDLYVSTLAMPTWYRKWTCSQLWIRILNFFRQRLFCNRRVFSRVLYNNSSGIATRTKSPPPPTIYEDIPVADRNKRSQSRLMFDHWISGAQKFCEKSTPEFRGHSLSKKKPP